jgi:hypothetical protein
MKCDSSTKGRGIWGVTDWIFLTHDVNILISAMSWKVRNGASKTVDDRIGRHDRARRTGEADERDDEHRQRGGGRINGGDSPLVNVGRQPRWGTDRLMGEKTGEQVEAHVGVAPLSSPKGSGASTSTDQR